MVNKLVPTIKEPFWSAGVKYGWDGAGIGLNINLFNDIANTDTLEVPVIISKKTEKFRISKEKARMLYKKYDSSKKAGMTTLVVLPLNEFDKL